VKDNNSTRQGVRELLEKSQKDAVGVLGVSLEQAADFFRGKQAGDSEKADEAKTMATLKNRTVADALKDVRLVLLFAMRQNFSARGELIRKGTNPRNGQSSTAGNQGSSKERRDW